MFGCQLCPLPVNSLVRIIQIMLIEMTGMIKHWGETCSLSFWRMDEIQIFDSLHHCATQDSCMIVSLKTIVFCHYFVLLIESDLNSIYQFETGSHVPSIDLTEDMWMQLRRRSPHHSYESCSMIMKPETFDLTGIKLSDLLHCGPIKHAHNEGAANFCSWSIVIMCTLETERY